MTITAKPTVYRGRRFRSRLEARWAVFFDAVGYAWRYEPEVQTAVAYQPDFELPDLGVYVEVKPGPSWPDPHDSVGWSTLAQGLEVIAKDDERWKKFADATGKPLWVCIGDPVRWIEGQPTAPALAWVYEMRPPGEVKGDLLVWNECHDCGKVAPSATLRWDDIPCSHSWYLGPVLRGAAATVRDHRYEDGAVLSLLPRRE